MIGEVYLQWSFSPGKVVAGGFTFQLLLGKPNISFRMYGEGFRALQRGWIKNYGTGALKTPPILFVMVFLWIMELFRIAEKIGDFRKDTIISFPIHMALFLWILIQSFIKKIFQRYTIKRMR